MACEAGAVGSTTFKVMKRSDLSVERLYELLEYNRQTGEFIRKRRSTRGEAGSVAGGRRRDGYVIICLDGVRFLAHRLAWLYCHGAHPVGCVDHIDGNPSNNRIENLRDVAHAVNLQNQSRAHKNNVSSGLLGVTHLPKTGRWKAAISLNGETRHIGVYATADSAHEAYVKVKRQIHEGSKI